MLFTVAILLREQKTRQGSPCVLLRCGDPGKRERPGKAILEANSFYFNVLIQYFTRLILHCGDPGKKKTRKSNPGSFYFNVLILYFTMLILRREQQNEKRKSKMFSFTLVILPREDKTRRGSLRFSLQNAFPVKRKTSSIDFVMGRGGPSP